MWLGFSHFCTDNAPWWFLLGWISSLPFWLGAQQAKKKHTHPTQPPWLCGLLALQSLYTWSVMFKRCLVNQEGEWRCSSKLDPAGNWSARWLSSTQLHLHRQIWSISQQKSYYAILPCSNDIKNPLSIDICVPINESDGFFQLSYWKSCWDEAASCTVKVIGKKREVDIFLGLGVSVYWPSDDTLSALHISHSCCRPTSVFSTGIIKTKSGLSGTELCCLKHTLTWLSCWGGRLSCGQQIHTHIWTHTHTYTRTNTVATPDSSAGNCSGLVVTIQCAHLCSQHVDCSAAGNVTQCYSHPRYASPVVGWN